MKKLRVMAMAECREELLKELQHLGCVHISEPSDRLADPAWSALLRRGPSQLTETKSEMTDVNIALAAIKRYAKLKDGLFIQRGVVSESQFLDPDTVGSAREVSRKVGDALQELTRLQGEESRLLSKQAGLEPWKPLDMPLELEGTAHAVTRLGVCPGGTDAGELRTALGASEAAAEIYEISADKQQTYLLLVCYRGDLDQALEVLRPYGFGITNFQDLTGTPAENLDRLDRQLQENRAAQEETAQSITASAEARDALRLYADRLSSEENKEANAEKLMTDGTILFFEGWLPAEREGEVRSLLERMNCAWETEDPTEEDIPEVPIQLKNNWFTRPLNMVTEMYSLPTYNNVDPNPLMAPFFILFYGIMMADMGYGILMVLAGLFITKKYRPKGTMGHMFSLLTLCGVSTFIVGAITGGFFGDFIPQLLRLINPASTFEFPSLFTPLNDTLMILVGAMALGLVHIIAGMAISFVRKIQAGNILDAIFEEATWWVVFAGIGLMALKITNIVLYVGCAMIVVGPLIMGKGIGKISGIFASLYNHVTGYFGDILSYARLMALMLAGSVIAQVFNTLGAIPGNIFFFIVVSFLGNTLNFALNLLGCYVHDLRLQCLEYFGKFYEDGGKPFQPLAFHTKYVDIEND